MKTVLLSAFVVLAVASPALARVHPLKHPSRGAIYGLPITAGSDAIRINASGEVISSPPPISAQEREATTPPAKQSAPAQKP